MVVQCEVIEPRWNRAAAAVAVMLVVVSTLSATVWADASRGDYTFFVQAWENLTARDGLYVYRWMPNIQSGPVSLLGYGLADLLGHGGFLVVVAALGLVAVGVIARWGAVLGRPLSVIAVGGVVVALQWRGLATWGHLDDGLVLVATIVSLDCIRRDRRDMPVLLLGLSLAIKPWAILFVPLLLGASGPWHKRLRPPAASCVIGALFWAPFIIATTDTLDGMRPIVLVAPDSIVHLFTRQALTELPPAVRIVQLTLGVAAVTWTVVRRRPSCALLVGVAVRLLFEAGTWPYYTIALVLGAFVWDVIESRSRVPWATLAASVLIFPPWWFDAPDLRASMRLVACLGALELARRTATRPPIPLFGAQGSTLAGSAQSVVASDAQPPDQLDAGRNPRTIVQGIPSQV